MRSSSEDEEDEGDRQSLLAGAHELPREAPSGIRALLGVRRYPLVPGLQNVGGGFGFPPPENNELVLSVSRIYNLYRNGVGICVHPISVHNIHNPMGM